MSTPKWHSIVVLRTSTTTLVPTGPALLRLVRLAGDKMVEARSRGQRDLYSQLKDAYIELLEIAQNDTYCAPILIATVQGVFDEESEIYRSGQRRIDKGQ